MKGSRPKEREVHVIRLGDGTLVEAAIWNDYRHKLEVAPKSLSEWDARLVKLLYFEEITVKDVAEIFGCSRKTIGKHRERVLQELRQQIGCCIKAALQSVPN